MKKIKCNYFVIVGYPHSPECFTEIEVPNDFKQACNIMNDAGWRKCGNKGQWGYFCPRHAEANQFYINPSTKKG